MPNPLKKQQGFTVQEMLVVIAITVILLGVSIVGVVAYVRHLQLKELDNAAREIFMAAQNRAMLIGSDKVKKAAVKADDQNRIDHVEIIPSEGDEATTQITVYYVHSSDEEAMKELLPQEAIDPALWDGDFYISYEPESASVVDVFYSDDTLPVEGELADFADFYMRWRKADKEERMKSRPMIGYYGGESAESGTALSLRTPVIQITNDNDLQVQVTHWVPRALQMIGQADQVSLDVELEYQGQKIPLTLDMGNQEEKPDIAYLIYESTWTLESLKEGKHFADLFSAPGTTLTYGEDFTIVAEVSYTGTLKVNGAQKTAQDNSLFAKDSGGETAYITCLRHLQNLDKTFSQVEGKTQARQLGDVEKVEDYIFQPVFNEELKSCDGGSFAITGLTAKSRKDQPAGVFGQMKGTEDAYRQLKNIHLVDASVTGGSTPTGALLGEGKFVSLTGCQVYWNNRREDGTTLQQLLGNSQDGLDYQITGQEMVGGLVGRLTNGTVTECSASTLVSSNLAAGGLLGQGDSVAIAQSYGACYVQAPEAAGLVGRLNAGDTATVDSSYAVGFVKSPEGGMAAGLCLGDGYGRVTSSYSAMLFTTGSVINYPLCQQGSYEKARYLDSDQFGFSSAHKGLALSYEELLDESRWDSLFGRETFDSLSAAQSHPYNLQTTLSLTRCRYPGLHSLEHWGDWGAQFQKGSLVYYECYEDGSYGFSGGDVSHLKDDRLVTEDGYAVAYQSTDSIATLGATLEVTYQGKMGEETEKFTYQKETDYYVMKDVQDLGKENDYYLLPLPTQVVNTAHASTDFYQKIAIQHITEDMVKEYYYNPHFAHDPRYAIAILDYEEGLDLDQMARQLPVLLRSPRHFWDLSSFDAYFASQNRYRFLQHLDLDYTVYRAYDLFTGNWKQHPVGTSYQSPFRGNYNGGFHEIRGVQLATTDLNGKECSYVGLFGYSTGVLQDVVYRMDENQDLQINRKGNRTQPLYVGGLVGYNGGTVENCAVYGGEIRASCYEQSIVYLGGLAGLNEGYIHSSTAQTKTVTAQANLSDAYAGSFAGRNGPGGTIDQCYGVGKVDVSRARYGTVYACGFAGRNEATIRRSYAAAALSAEGGALRFGFCADPTYDCVYLDQGNFSYLGENYGAQYEDDGATSVTWAQLAGQQASTAVDAMGMGRPVSAAQGNYPYPGTLTGAGGQYIHYGAWPDRMDLGSMGVYYWEELVIDGASSYHLSAISDGGNQAIYSSTLSEAHGDNGVVTQYGYGYFHQSSLSRPTLQSQDIYWDDRLFSVNYATTNQKADDALRHLMGEQYQFYSYNTWQKDQGQGLHLVVNGENQASNQPPVGTWTLNNSFTVRLNPLFAASMSTMAQALPGTESSPYQVRSIQQLQFINWYAYQGQKTVNRVAAPGGGEGYLFLNNRLTAQQGRQYSWVQTHDLDGSQVKDYTPIAALYDEIAEGTKPVTPGKIIAWFSGSYNGNDYTIQELSISTENVNTTGLFGVTVNANLSNIVLYSPSGKATISATNPQNSSEYRTWYAIGGLVGLAANTGESNRSIQNCAVAGYTIYDNNSGCEYGGGGVGGLVGICNMALSKCTAVTRIELNFRHSDNARNIRVGGIAGSCQKTITNCYSGGSIVQGENLLESSASNLHIGGITGGYFMKTLNFATAAGYTPPPIQAGLEKNRVPELLVTTFNNCYTYVDVDHRLKEITKAGGSYYAIGGLGEIFRKENSSRLANYKKCFYLAQTADNSALDRSENVQNCSYKSLSSGDAFKSLQNAGFSTVTTKTDQGDSLDGRYSFGNDLSLLGKDYPFPTILTQSSDLVESKLANVHYGDWPLEGIRRPSGALPVNLDLFADYSEEKGGAVWEETFTLSGVEPGGKWWVESAAPAIAQAQLTGSSQNDCTVQVTALQAGSTTVTVSYLAPGQTEPYTLDVTVNVTANLRLAAADPLPVKAFTEERVEVPLELRDGENRPLPEKLKEQIQMTALTTEFDPAYFTQVETDFSAISLAAESRQALGATQMTLAYDFTYGAASYQATSALSLEVETAEVRLPPLEFVLKAGETEQKQNYTAQNLELWMNGEQQIVKEIHIVEIEEVGEEMREMIWAQWAVDSDGAEIPGTVEITAYAQKIYPTIASVRLRIAFQYEGRTHIQWQYLQVNIRDQAEGGQP